MAFYRATPLHETSVLVQTLNGKDAGFLAKVGKLPDQQLLVSILFEALGETTMADAENEGLDIDYARLRALESFITERSMNTMARQNFWTFGSNAMHVCHVGEGEPGAPSAPGHGEAMPVREKTGLECWTCKGKSHPYVISLSIDDTTITFRCRGCGGKGRGMPYCTAGTV